MRRLLLAALLLASPALAQVAVTPAPWLEGTVVGRVCEDQDADGLCAPGEPGLAHVRLVLSDGREVLTDAQGRFHFAGLEARRPDDTRGLHLRPGRYRLKVDARTLPPGTLLPVQGATVELPWGALALQDFAVRREASGAAPLALSYAAAPPSAERVDGVVQFLAAGQAAPGDAVSVAGVPAQVDAQGAYRALVPLQEGPNALAIRAQGAGGSLRLYTQRVDVVAREGGWLVVPRAPEATGALQLPATGTLPSGRTALHFVGTPGTRVRAGEAGTEAIVGPEGSADVPLTLRDGANTVLLQLSAPAGPPRTERLQLQAAPRAFAVGLLDVEGSYAPKSGALRLVGRGAAHGELQLGQLSLMGELNLQDTDREAGFEGWRSPRRVERFERAPDPDLAPAEWGDTSTGLAANPAEAGLRLEARHPLLGRAGFGTYRAWLGDRELGRYHRPLFGPYAELQAPVGAVRVGLDAFAGGLHDPTRGLSASPAHAELRATGGSLYYLGTGSVAEGSEVLRVELRDGVTGLPLAERHLVRGRDYDVDYLSGRVLLAEPLSFVGGTAWLTTDPLTAAPEPVLVADFAALHLGEDRGGGGAEAWAELGPARLSVSALQEGQGEGHYALLGATAQTQWQGYTLLAEAARSRGRAVAEERFGLSDDGGLSFLRPAPLTSPGGDALGLRLRGPGVGGGGRLEAAARVRSAGFSDDAHADAVRARQLSLNLEQPLGPFTLTLLGDARSGADPRLPFGEAPLRARTLGAGLGYEQGSWGVRAEVRDSELEASEVAGERELLEGGRTSAGVNAHLRVHEGVVLSAGHRQSLVQRGEGPGRLDDTFTSAGVDLSLGEARHVGVRGGWGPELGPLVWAEGSVRRGQDTYYGGYSVDVDGPDVGAARAVSGASTDVAAGTRLYVEDVSAHDANAVRLARAVGFEQLVTGALRVGARYERGVRSPLDLPSNLTRDVGALSVQWVLERLRLQARAELRDEHGASDRAPSLPVDRRQAVVGLAADLTLRRDLSASGRLDVGHTVGQGALEARFVEGYAALAWRPGPLALVGRYALTRELSPGEGSVLGERALQVFSLLPALQLGGRVGLAGGAHLGRSGLGGSALWVFTGSVRPSVRVVGGLEVAAELLRRSVAQDGDSLHAVRAELAYRFDERLRLAAGYGVLGFRGLGMSPTPDEGRVYLRAEAAY
ncbi:flagellar motor protein [Aggregicoccus sp. 17bor-14]|uniref:flagellar motor protein n=1 Tax=Myxococcaceae TaxID=31 RepID=UPI00129C1871|nr:MULTISPECIES: flagellar motor protein [Myxococcaceae]MBF5044222.1 flagellar motor protein [Simulacricoccus sp. 17bor-14]MRI89972.1 flagellar motor protein [Aggregicoccus sp. 17bor-14]